MDNKADAIIQTLILKVAYTTLMPQTVMHIKFQTQLDDTFILIESYS